MKQLTFDALYDGDDALLVIMTGAEMAPTVVDLGSGSSARLAPLRVHEGVVGCWMALVEVSLDQANGWWGRLPAQRGEPVRLWADIDGTHYRFTIRPKELPPPLPPSRQRKRTARARSS